MSLQGSAPQVVLPADVQKAIELAQNRAAILEAESNRLAGIIESFKVDIAALSDEKQGYLQKMKELVDEAQEATDRAAVAKKTQQESERVSAEAVANMERLQVQEKGIIVKWQDLSERAEKAEGLLAELDDQIKEKQNEYQTWCDKIDQLVSNLNALKL